MLLLSTVFFCILLPICFSSISASCFDVDIRYNESLSANSATQPSYTVFDDTRKCFERLNQISPEPSPDLPNCPPGVLDFTVQALPVIIPNTNALPHVIMNISALVHVPVEKVFLRMQCLHASDMSDVYCHQPETLVHINGSVVYPCRGLDLYGSEPDLPLRFGYSCFRMFGFSQYRVNATVFPLNCRRSVIVSIPSFADAFPEIIAYLNGTTVDRQTAHWSPFLSVDAGEDNGVWISFAPPQDYPWREMKLAVAQRRQAQNTFSILKEFTVAHPLTGVKWTDVPSGEYTVFAYVPRHDCSLVCEPNNPHCSICTHTPVNFTLSSHKASFAWLALRTIKDAGVVLIFIIIGFFLISLVVFGVVIAYLRRRAVKNPRDVELRETPSVLFLFADDFQEHVDVVLGLARCLERIANARVLVDQRELVRTSDQPSRWLVEKVAECRFVVIILSPVCPFLLRGKKLEQRRPFPDLFNTGVNLLISKLAKPDVSKNQFAILRLPYSPPVPSELQLLDLKTFEVPSQLVNLSGFLHGMSSSSRLFHSGAEREMGSIYELVRKAEAHVQNDPHWMDDRFVPSDICMPTTEMDEVPVRSPERDRMLTHKERIEEAERLGLLPPDEEEEPECVIDYMAFGDSDTPLESGEEAAVDIPKQEKSASKRRHRSSCHQKTPARKKKKAEELPHPCPHCHLRFQYPNKLNRHIDNKHSKKHVCARCGTAFDEFSEVRSHYATAHRTLVPCELCDYKHYKKAMVRRHFHKMHIMGIRCPVAGCLATMSAYRLGGHIRRLHTFIDSQATCEPVSLTIPSHKCEHCVYETKDPAKFEEHLLNEHVTGLQCPVEGCSQMVFLRHLAGHLQMDHNIERPQVPEDADTESIVSGVSRPLSAPGGGWWAHEQQLSDTDEESEDEQRKAEEHGKRGERGDDGARVERVVTEEIPEKEVTNALPNSHRATLMKELINGSHTCDHCDKGFASRDSLRKHIARVHEKRYEENRRRDRQYKCSFDGCSKGFTTPGLLEDHLNTHSGISPHQCSMCERSFSGRSLLAKHLKRTHNTSIKHLCAISRELVRPPATSVTSGTAESRIRETEEVNAAAESASTVASGAPVTSSIVGSCTVVPGRLPPDVPYSEPDYQGVQPAHQSFPTAYLVTEPSNGMVERYGSTEYTDIRLL